MAAKSKPAKVENKYITLTDEFDSEAYEQCDKKVHSAQEFVKKIDIEENIKMLNDGGWEVIQLVEGSRDDLIIQDVVTIGITSRYRDITVKLNFYKLLLKKQN